MNLCQHILSYFGYYRALPTSETARYSLIQFDVDWENKEIINRLRSPTYGDSNYGFPTGLRTAFHANLDIAFTCSYNNIGNRIGPFSIFGSNGKMEYSGELDENQQLTSICKYEQDVIYKWKRNFLYDNGFEYCCIFSDGRNLYFNVQNALAHGRCKVVKNKKGYYAYYQNGRNVGFLCYYLCKSIDFVKSLWNRIFYHVCYSHLPISQTNSVFAFLYIVQYQKSFFIVVLLTFASNFNLSLLFPLLLLLLFLSLARLDSFFLQLLALFLGGEDGLFIIHTHETNRIV